MPIQLVGYAGTSRLGTTSNSVNVSLTSLTGGIGSAALAGDFVLALFATGSTAQRTLSITDGTNAYSTLTSQLYSDNTYDVNYRVAYKFMGGTPDTTTTFGPTGSADDSGSCLVMVFRGVDQTTPIDIAVETATGTNTAIPVIPAITPANTGAFPVACFASGHNLGSRNYFGSTSPYTSGVVSTAGGDVNDTSQAVLYKNDWASGSVTGPTLSLTGSTTTHSWVAAAFALRASTSTEATLSPTEGSDTASVAASAAHTAALAASETADIAALSLEISPTAQLAATETTDTATFSVTAENIVTAAVTEGADAAAFDLVAFHTAALAAAEGADVASFGVAAAHTLDLAATEGSDVPLVLFFDGVAVIFGASEGGDTASFAAAIEQPLGAVLGATEQADRANFFDALPGVVAPSYGYWAKSRRSKKPLGPKLPEPVNPGQVAIDEAVLRQMEEERRAALALKAKQEALRRVEALRAGPLEAVPSKSVKLEPKAPDAEPEVSTRSIRLGRKEMPPTQERARKFVNPLKRQQDVVTSPEIRARVITLFKAPPKTELQEPVRTKKTVRGLGPRHIPEPELRKARTISLRRSPDLATP